MRQVASYSPSFFFDFLPQSPVSPVKTTTTTPRPVAPTTSASERCYSSETPTRRHWFHGGLRVTIPLISLERWRLGSIAVRDENQASTEVVAITAKVIVAIVEVVSATAKVCSATVKVIIAIVEDFSAIAQICSATAQVAATRRTDGCGRGGNSDDIDYDGSRGGDVSGRRVERREGVELRLGTGPDCTGIVTVPFQFVPV
ncbi:hypothetical protein H5410_008970 [Solanum commersonii]|uniref:Uncharacterized protein n=1 Tax=Solanum commersonii TaxID=4109 RepID=A0A9J6AGQ1_SOLCO|nr:hypothetical protein H5410_008970 [Solanum commersonii]